MEVVSGTKVLRIIMKVPYNAKDVSDIQIGEWASVPMTFRTNLFKYVSITEAALTNYSGMALKCDGQRGFGIRLAHSQPLSTPFKLHYGEEAGSKLMIPASIKGRITTPWRVIIIGADLNGIVNANLVEMLAPKPDSSLFPRVSKLHGSNREGHQGSLSMGEVKITLSERIKNLSKQHQSLVWNMICLNRTGQEVE